MALLTALVFAGALVVLHTGAGAVDQLEQRQTDADARLALAEADERLTTMTSSSGAAERRFGLGDLDRGDVRVVRDGYVNVTVDRNGTCATEVPLSSIRYEGDGESVVAYEAGGVWERTAGENASALRSPPDVTFRNGSLDVTVVNLTGTVDEPVNDLVHNETSSRAESAARSASLFRGECARPDNVTLEVRSDFYRAWARHLSGETGVDAETFDGNRTARVHLEQSDLPRRANDSRNRVIDLTNESDYMDAVEAADNSVRVSKGVPNTYRVYAQPLSDGNPQIGQVRRIENATNVTRPPMDVVVIMDESGSMSWDANPDAPGCEQGESNWDCTSKLEAAQSAAKNFTGSLNGSKDRIGLVGFTTNWYDDEWQDDSRFFTTDGRYLSSDLDEFNDTIETSRADGGTNIYAGIRRANTVHGLKSDQTREQVTVLLSDGENDPDTDTDGHRVSIDGTDYTTEQATEIRADRAAAMGQTVHTIGFGARHAIDEELLKYVNGTSGGNYYYADDAEELNDAFQDIVRRITSTRQIAMTPATTNFTTESGQVFGPRIAGDTDGVANVNAGGRQFLNVNDPTAPSTFTHTFGVEDNETVTFNASTYDCAEWVGTGRREEHNGTTYQVTRCANMTTTDEVIGPDDTTVYTDGDNFNSTLKDGAPAWWQEDLNRTIARNPDVALNATNHLQLQKNRAVVVMDFPDAHNATNRLVMLYQVGLAESNAETRDVVNVRVESVTVE